LLIFGINSPREAFKNETVHRRKPGSLHHLAFKAGSKEEVDKLFTQVKEAGAQIVEEPRYFPQHGEKYYATFFKDPDGIKYEIVFEERK
jgi:predicted lactoylglutathione lyase